MAVKPNELQIIRVYDAPVKLVWDAWTDPKKAAKWWGPRGFTITTISKDLRPGGTWKYTMHGPDGTDYPNLTVYHEVEKYSRLVYDHGGTETDPPLFRVTVTFKEELGKTIMNMIMAFENVEKAKEIGKFIKQASGNSTWDRLGEYLENEDSGKDPFIINRTFAAPIEKVFEFWTDVKHLAKWLPPGGFDMKILSGELKVGQSLLYSMSNGDMTLFGKSTYQEINPVTKISYLQMFTDKDGKPSKHPMMPVWPEAMMNTIIFTPESPTLTRVTLTTRVHGNATAAEQETFSAAKGGMTMGWNGSFDRLDELL